MRTEKSLDENYQILAILLVEGDRSAFWGAIFAGLFDANICDIWKITQCLQLLNKEKEQIGNIKNTIKINSKKDYIGFKINLFSIKKNIFSSIQRQLETFWQFYWL